MNKLYLAIAKDNYNYDPQCKNTYYIMAKSIKEAIEKLYNAQAEYPNFYLSEIEIKLLAEGADLIL